ncbi:MAG: hypothetical protein ACE5EG_01995 [Thermoanaerobaculia bacterium]
MPRTCPVEIERGEELRRETIGRRQWAAFGYVASEADPARAAAGSV